jgi:hypothetical protein
MQRRPAVTVRGIHVGLVSEQRFRHVLMAPIRRPVQWRLTALSLALTSARLDRSNSTSSLCPINAATCKGVSPL